jgi:hypothetical protein
MLIEPGNIISIKWSWETIWNRRMLELLAAVTYVRWANGFMVMIVNPIGCLQNIMNSLKVMQNSIYAPPLF